MGYNQVGPATQASLLSTRPDASHLARSERPIQSLQGGEGSTGSGKRFNPYAICRSIGHAFEDLRCLCDMPARGLDAATAKTQVATIRYGTRYPYQASSLIRPNTPISFHRGRRNNSPRVAPWTRS